jgi:hypothetical protein
MIYKLNKRELRELEKTVISRIEAIVFSKKRPSGKQKVKGGLQIKDDTGNLRKTIKSNRNFITQNSKGGIEIEVVVTDYFQYLDDARRAELNWYISEGVFEDRIIADKLEEILSKMVINASIDFITEK